MIFRSDFDLNKNRKIEPSELALAQQFVGRPEATANFVYANQGGNSRSPPVTAGAIAAAG